MRVRDRTGGGDVDDQPAAGSEEQRGAENRCNVMGTRAHVDDPIPGFDRQLPVLLAQPRGELRRGVDVVDENVELALLLLHPLEESGDLIVLVVVDRDRDADTAQRIDLRGRLPDRAGYGTGLDRTAREIDGCSCGTQLQRDALADAAACSRDDGDLSGQVDIRRDGVG